MRGFGVKRVVVFLCGLMVMGVACNETAEPEATKRIECTEPEFAPTYLPWEKGSIPEPELFFAQGNATAQWVAPADAKSPGKVSLVRAARPWKTYEREFPIVPVRGTEGTLVWIGDPGTGELSLQWSEGDQPCDHYAIYLLLPSVSQRDAEKEMARISRSLISRSLEES